MKYINVSFIIILFAMLAMFLINCADNSKDIIYPRICRFDVKIEDRWIEGTIDQDRKKILLHGIANAQQIECVKYELSSDVNIYPKPETKVNEWKNEELFQLVSKYQQKVTYSVILPDYIGDNKGDNKVDNPKLISPENLVGIICKTGQEDQDIPLFNDMLLGGSIDEFVSLLKENLSSNINVICIPIAVAMYEKNTTQIMIRFLKNLIESGRGDLKVILCLRKWDLHMEKSQQSWAEQIAYAFNSLKKEKIQEMVIGCMFDENRALKGAQSSEVLWDMRHSGILKALDNLNAMTDNAFKKRMVFIHGKGYGSQFLGVKASSDKMNFKSEMAKRCADYVYNYKFFESGIPSDKSLNGWKNHFKEYCSLKEVHELGVPLIFVGDAGDGLRSGCLEEGNKNPYGGPGPHAIKALRDTFLEYGWSGFVFGFCFSPVGGQTILANVEDGHIKPNEDVTQTWRLWYETTRIVD